jgi:hypothetical protein
VAESFFSRDYSVARERFRESAANAGAHLDTLSLMAKRPEAEGLSIDIAWLGARYPRRALIHSSGLHGIEGFAGSAIQLQILNDPPPLQPDSAIVIVHILNPYGMASLRRVNENNVDLNRNFRLDGNYQGAPPMYVRLYSFLNPSSGPALDLFYIRAASLIFRHGMSALKQAVVGGQYEYPKGLFFGGKALEQGPQLFLEYVRERLAAAQQAIAIDVHTGLGKYAEDTLLVAPEDVTRLRTAFGNRVTSAEPDEGPAYRIEGGLESMLCPLFERGDVSFIRQEFGTYSGPRVLHALREENRWHHHGAGTLEHPVKRALKQIFSPDDEAWRASVLRRGGDLFQKAITPMSQP